VEQGFDEFMNLVIDDAVEVQLATKDGPEKRRQLGGLIPSLIHAA
jgi:small nuclear ribonucleoprotein E